MVNPRVLSIEAVNALVPRLRELMQVQMARREEIEQRLGCPLPTCHAELEVALRLEDLDDNT